MNQKITEELYKTKVNEVIVPCAKCSGRTAHEVVTSIDQFVEDTDCDVQWMKHYQIMRCKGCKIISFRDADLNSVEYIQAGDHEWDSRNYEELYPLCIEGRKYLGNSALGAALIWRFARGYCPPDTSINGVPLMLAYTVLPLMFNEDTRSKIISTQSSVYKFEEKYKDKYDLLYLIQGRAMGMRDLTRRSICIGISSGLLNLVPEDGSIYPIYQPVPRSVTRSAKELLKAAEKLGEWAKQFSLFEFSRTLHLDF